MLPSQDAMIFSIATSVRLYAIGSPLLKRPMPYPGVIGAKFGVRSDDLVARESFPLSRHFGRF
jgi:hypothetical protein